MGKLSITLGQTPASLLRPAWTQANLKACSDLNVRMKCVPGFFDKLENHEQITRPKSHVILALFGSWNSMRI
ncbi:MAG TPA: hypothetical protein VMW36_04920 [Patescibacteria group bacterium]|nr:hypothetical protein [Patescibacteria group bacterium]